MILCQLVRQSSLPRPNRFRKQGCPKWGFHERIGHFFGFAPTELGCVIANISTILSSRWDFFSPHSGRHYGSRTSGAQGKSPVGTTRFENKNELERSSSIFNFSFRTPLFPKPVRSRYRPRILEKIADQDLRLKLTK